MVVRTGVVGSSEPALVFPVIAFHCSLQELQTLKTKGSPKSTDPPLRILDGMSTNSSRHTMVGSIKEPQWLPI